MTKNYQIPAAAIETEYEVKKSRFIARLSLASTREEAMLALEKARQDYPDARHHCWAYLLGAPSRPISAAMSDDGEPSGTAGKPILNVMQHKDVGDSVVIVIRYFGGIKLGAGGLVRAYSAAAQQAYDELTTETKVFLDELIVQCGFSEEQSIRHWLSMREGLIRESSYAEKVRLTIGLSEQHIEEFKTFIANLKEARFLSDTD